MNPSHEFCRAPLHPGPCAGWKAAKAAGRDHTVRHDDLISNRSVRAHKARPLPVISRAANAKPEALSPDQFDLAVPETKRLYRGVSSEQGASATRRGELGGGDYGPGIYTDRRINFAQTYMGNQGTGRLLRMGLKPGAKVKTIPARVEKGGTESIRRWADENDLDAYISEPHVIVRNPGALIVDGHDYTSGEAVVLDYDQKGYRLPPEYEADAERLRQLRQPDTPDGVQLARARQADIDRVRSRADLVAEAAQLIDYQADPDTIAHRLHADARRHGVQDAPEVRELLAAADSHDRDKLEQAMFHLTQKLNVQRTAVVGSVAGFNGREMRHVGGAPARGTPVHVIRPGFSYIRPDGEQIQIIKADVEDADEDEIAAFRRGAQTAAAVSHEFCQSPLHPGPCKGWKGVKALEGGVAPLPRSNRATTPRARLRTLSDDQLADRFADISRADQLDEHSLRQIIGEMDRREKKPAKPFKQSKAQAALDARMEAGDDYTTAAASTIDRRKGESLDQAVRRHHDEWLDLSYLQAEGATRGHMLSPAGRAAGIDPRSLFTGTLDRARRYGSEELLRWWTDHPRLNRAQYRAQLLGRTADVKAAKKTRAASTGRDFI